MVSVATKALRGSLRLPPNSSFSGPFNCFRVYGYIRGAPPRSLRLMFGVVALTVDRVCAGF